MQKTPVIIDTDIGSDIDDTWALGLLLKSPELDLKLVTTVTQDTPYRAKIAAKLLEIAGRTDVDVGLGPRETETWGPQASWVMDYDLAGYPGQIHENAIEALVNAILSSPEPVTIITIGPLTNIALALEKEPEIASRARIMGMLGSIRSGYNGKPSPDPEYNVIQDVSACRAVFSAPWEITITPLDTCGTVVLSGEQYEAISRSNDPITASIVENYEIWAFAHGNTKKLDKSSVLFDTVAVYLAISEDFTAMEMLDLAISDKGMMHVDENGRPVRCATDWRGNCEYEDWLVQRLLS
ncbi:MAG TPA: nucleoside hydrolase [Candidatus Lokiarchaeia archaeon]|nr:nucleoside hydrolase [Candidatus Lokiarchaeia archaeon]